MHDVWWKEWCFSLVCIVFTSAQVNSTGPMVEAKKTHANDTSKGLKHEESYTQPTETKVIPTVTIPFGHGTNHRDPAQRHTSDWTHNGAQRKPSMTMTQGGKVRMARDTMSL